MAGSKKRIILITSILRSKATIGLNIFLAIALIACTPVVKRPLDRTGSGTLVWPESSARPRLEYVMSIYGPDDLGIERNFMQQLRELISGPSQIRLIRPMAVTEGPDGKIYVSDPGARGVHLFDTARGRYQLIQGENSQPLPSPVALVTGIRGEVYISDSRLGAVYVIEPGANEAVKVPLAALLAQPTGLALDPSSGRLYLVDTGSHEVKVFARDGALLKRFGRRGTGIGEFNYPTMIWMNKLGELLVADSMNFRIQVFDFAGNFLRQFGEVGDGAGYQAQPKGIATDSSSHIYIVDSLMHAVQIFDSLGTFLFKLGFRGEAAGEFWLPAGIFIGARDTIYVADSYNGRVQVFRYIGGESP